MKAPSLVGSPQATTGLQPEPSREVTDTLASADLRDLGGRIRRSRRDRGLTQSDACAGIVSTAYLSRIESGERRPTLKVLESLAQRLDTSAHELLLGLTSQGWSAREVELDWAQLSLRAGEADRALVTTERLLGELPTDCRLYRRTLTTHALALEATGDYAQAALKLEELLDGADLESGVALEAMTALSRMYREAGEFTRAIEVGDRAARHLDETGLADSPEALKLTLTIAGAHLESGAIDYAARLCQRALKKAEAGGDPRQRAGCYWEASIAESRRGNDVEALALAQRALHVLDEADSARNSARLRTQVGILHLRMSPPQIESALAQLSQAEGELMTSDASPVDLADNRLAQARARFLRGAPHRARREAQQVLDAQTGSTPLIAAEAHVLLGQISFAGDDREQARACYRQAILGLSAVGADRAAAQLWFELGGLWRAVGCPEEALDAFERAGASTGLRTDRPSEGIGAADPRKSALPLGR